MKKFALIALLTITLAAPAFASQAHQAEVAQERASNQAAQMTSRKSAATKELNVRITAAQKKLTCLQTQQSCVNNAADVTSLNKCHPEACKD